MRTNAPLYFNFFRKSSIVSSFVRIIEIIYSIFKYNDIGVHTYVETIVIDIVEKSIE